MIIAVNMNPALDKTVHVEELRPRALNRVHDISVDAGGKGVNVAEVAAVLGAESLLMGFSGGEAGERFEALAAARGVRTDFTRIRGATRTNLKVIDRSGGLTEINEPGPEVSAAEMAALEAKLAAHAAPGVTFALGGKLPPAAPPGTYLRLCRLLRGAGARVCVDADGEAFRRALEAPPDFLKPNRHELLELFGQDEAAPASDAVLAGLCRRLAGRGASLVGLSLGAEGALFVAAGETTAWRAPPLAVEVGSTVGAGDAVVAALAVALERGDPPEAAFRLAMAASAAAVTTPGTRAPPRSLIESLLPRVVLNRLDLV